mmetsp:Transcript_41592/g.102637  ORF Transcript_41592/g.102637 Transcript_41592/m.102637 type:complete len:252 (+) Transcript_41592:1723-2478(+)
MMTRPSQSPSLSRTPSPRLPAPPPGPPPEAEPRPARGRDGHEAEGAQAGGRASLRVQGLPGSQQAGEGGPAPPAPERGSPSACAAPQLTRSTRAAASGGESDGERRLSVQSAHPQSSAMAPARTPVLRTPVLGTPAPKTRVFATTPAEVKEMVDEFEVIDAQIKKLKYDLTAAHRARADLHDKVRKQLESAESIQQLANAAGTPDDQRRELKRLLACIAPDSEWLKEDAPDAAGGQSRTAEPLQRSKRARR